MTRPSASSSTSVPSDGRLLFEISCLSLQVCMVTVVRFGPAGCQWIIKTRTCASKSGCRGNGYLALKEFKIGSS